MINKNMIVIDGEKLRNVLKNREIAQNEVSRALGYSSNYLSMCLRANKVRKNVIEYLWREHGIKPILFVPTKEPEKNDIQTISEMPSDEFFKELHKVIYSAVYEAVKKAWSE